MGADKYAAKTSPTTTKVTSSGTSVVPVTDTPDRAPVTLDVNPNGSDDAVQALVKREVAILMDKIHRVNHEIEQARYLVDEAQGRKALLEAQVAKYASFLS